MGAQSPSDELEYFKSLVNQLNEKIKSLEQKVVRAMSPTPAEQLRLILVGPPGAGESLHLWLGLFDLTYACHASLTFL